MTNTQLEGFRRIAAAMQTEPTDWEWVGKWMSQRTLRSVTLMTRSNEPSSYASV